MEKLKLNIQMFADGDVVVRIIADDKDFQNGLNRIQKSSKSAGATVRNIVAGLGITKLISKGMQLITSSVDDAVKRVDTLNNFSKVMGNLGVSAKDADASIKLMSDKLTGLPTTLDQGALAVQRFTSKNGDVKKSTDLFLALNNAILAGGAPTEMQASALEQLSQAYAKGKPDMMEWRSIQTAMPAQLKQVAIAMGYAGGNADALGEDLRKGNVSMDDFMDAVIKLNKQGVKGFKSFEKQARNSTAGIGTAITVAKTQVVKGVADIIGGIDKGLKKSGTSISKIVADFGKKFKVELDKIANALSKIDWAGVFNVLKKMVPILASVVTGLIAYRTVLAGIKAIDFAKDLMSATKVFLGLVPAIQSATVSQTALNMAQAASPVGLIVTGVAALTVALIAFGQQTSKATKYLKESDDELKNYKNTMKDLQKQKDESLSKSMNEIYYYQSLSDELKEITDENGKVKAGYEERASFITGKLSEALGMEIKMNNGVIENHKEIQKQIDKTLEKKKAEAYFNAHEQEYNEMLQEEARLQAKVEDATKKRKSAMEKVSAALDTYGKKYKGLSKYQDEYIKYLKGEKDFMDLSTEARHEYNKLQTYEVRNLKKLMEEYEKYDEALNKNQKAYADNEVAIDKHRRAEEAFAQGHYDAVAKIFNDTVTFNAKTQEENNKAFEEGKASRLAYLDFLKEHKDKYDADFIASEEKRVYKELDLMEAEKNEANKKIQEKNKVILGTTTAGLNDQLKALGDKKYEFKKTADGNLQLYVDGIKQKKPVALKTAQGVVDDVIGKLKSGKIGAEEAGKMLMLGLEAGMNGRAAVTGSMALAISGQILANMKAGLDEQSPSKATKKMGIFLLQGLDIGIDKQKRTTLKNIDEFSSEVLEKMNSAVSMQTGKMATNIQTSGTYQVAMSGMPTFNLKDNSTNQTQLVVNGKVLAEVVNTENRNREVAKS